MFATRRDLMIGAGASALAATLPGRAFAAQAAPGDARAQALLDRIAETRLKDSPEDATNLGIDKDRRAALTGKLLDRSPAGQQAIATHLREAVRQLDAV